MSHIEDIRKKIEELRKLLDQAINDGDSLTSEKVVIASKMLDAALNQYDEIIKGK